MAYAPPFEIRELSLPGVLLITPKVFADARGYAVVTYAADAFAALGIRAAFTQDFASYSVKDVN